MNKEDNQGSKKTSPQNPRGADLIAFMLISFVICMLISWGLIPVIFGSKAFDPGFFTLCLFLALGPAIIIGLILFHTTKPDSLPASNNNSHIIENENKSKSDVGISSMSDKLIELKKLLDQSVITEEEFTKLKNEVIGKNK